MDKIIVAVMLGMMIIIAFFIGCIGKGDPYDNTISYNIKTELTTNDDNTIQIPDNYTETTITQVLIDNSLLEPDTLTSPYVFIIWHQDSVTGEWDSWAESTDQIKFLPGEKYLIYPRQDFTITLDWVTYD